MKDITRFLEGFWEKSPSVERLRTDVPDSWIKLGMSEPYQPKGFGKVAVLTEPGAWELQSNLLPSRAGLVTDSSRQIDRMYPSCYSSGIGSRHHHRQEPSGVKRLFVLVV